MKKFSFDENMYLHYKSLNSEEKQLFIDVILKLVFEDKLEIIKNEKVKDYFQEFLKKFKTRNNVKKAVEKYNSKKSINLIKKDNESLDNKGIEENTINLIKKDHESIDNTGKTSDFINLIEDSIKLIKKEIKDLENPTEEELLEIIDFNIFKWDKSTIEQYIRNGIEKIKIVDNAELEEVKKLILKHRSKKIEMWCTLCTYIFLKKYIYYKYNINIYNKYYNILDKDIYIKYINILLNIGNLKSVNQPKITIKNNDATNEQSNNSTSKIKQEFLPPKIEEIEQYLILKLKEQNIEVSFTAIDFYNYYSENNWLKRDGKTGKEVPMKNWKQTLITWITRNKNNTGFSTRKENKAVPEAHQFGKPMDADIKKRWDELIKKAHERSEEYDD